MRISGGSAKGRNVRVSRAFSREASSDELRPTSAKVRKAIFDILQDRIIGAHFVDLYAGTGAVGIEALSRGAREVTFVDSSIVRTRAIRDLAARLGFGDRTHIIMIPARRFLSSSASASGRSHGGAVYDIVFADPPYGSEDLEEAFTLISGGEILTGGGTLIVEHSSKKALPAAAGTLSLQKVYRYGDTSLSVYRSRNTAEGADAQDA